MSTVLENENHTRESILVELKRREWWKSISIEEAYRRGHEYIDNLWK